MLERNKFKSLHMPHENSILVRSVRDDASNAAWTLGGRGLDDASQWDLRKIYSMVW
jgi:hypothetical protein